MKNEKKLNHHSLEAGTAVGVAVGLDEAQHGGGVDVVVLIEEGAPRIPPHSNPYLAALGRSYVFVRNESLEIINLREMFYVLILGKYISNKLYYTCTTVLLNN